MKRLLELKRNLLFFQARVDLSALLPCGYNLGEHLAAFRHVAVDQATNASHLPERKRSGHGRGRDCAQVPPRREGTDDATPNKWSACQIRPAHGFSHLAQLNFSHHAQHVIFALEIVEESALADIRGFGDVFHRDIGKAALGKKLERAAEQAHTSFGRATLAPSQACK